MPFKTSSRAMSQRWRLNSQAMRYTRTKMRSQARWILPLMMMSIIRANEAFFQETLVPMVETKSMRRKLRMLKIGNHRDKTSPKTLWAGNLLYLQQSWVLIKIIDRCPRKTYHTLAKSSPKMLTQKPKPRVSLQLVQILMKFLTLRASNTII